MLRSASGHLETGPGRIRTYDQGIHLAPAFPPGVDYLFTRARTVRVGAGCSKPVIKGASALRKSLHLPPVYRRLGSGLPWDHIPKGSLNSSRPLRAFPREGTSSMSPLH